VDGRDRLRRYLEQRREAGEREFVLDGLTTEDVLRILGAAAPSAADSAQRILPGAPAATSPPSVVAPARPPEADWRAVLAAAERDVPVPRVREPGVPPAPPTVPPPGRGRREAPGELRAEPPAWLPAPPPAPHPAPPEASSPSAPGRWPSGLAVGLAAGDLFGGPMSAYRTLDDIDQAVAACTRCPLYGTATHPVPGEGSAAAGLVCVGEAPGATEDATGRPFVGPAGKLLDKILGAIHLAREDVFICNVLKHRPPANRNPLPTEVAACSPYLVRQLELIRPRVIVAFGTLAAQTLLETTQSIGKLRGAVHRYYGVPLIVTYHPAALLRNPAWKRPTWEDVQYARRILDGTGV
jgi:uracil-DNA glycosylase